MTSAGTNVEYPHMATAAPHVKLLRQLASAKDDYLSGAFDISWDGAKATLYLVFGRPSHAVFETDQEQIEGEAAIDALLAALPRAFFVSDWRRAMSPHETLSITIDELAGPFVRLAGSYADDPVTDESPEWWSAIDDSPDLPFGLADFPLLPGGRPLWVEASPDEVRLADRIAGMPPSILILTGAKLRAAAVVSGGDIIDAVWLDADDHARGETAALALLGATKGSLAGYALDDPRVAEALTMLWRLPPAVSGVELSWLDPASMLAAFRSDGLDRVLVIDAPVRGIALFSRGGLAAVYSETQRSAVASPERLRSLLSQARGRLTVMERKPRPLAADAAVRPATSAHDFFEVAEPETAAVDTVAAAPLPVAEVDTPADAAEDTSDESLAVVTELPADPARAWDFATAGDAPSNEAPDGATASGREAAQSEEVEGSTFVLPPPPPTDDVAAELTETPPPPPPAPESEEPAQKAKRSRWGFGRSRKSRSERHAAEQIAAAITDASAEPGGEDPAAFAGWSVRQPNAEPQPVWLRSHDTGDAPASGPEAEGGEPAPTWSLAKVDEHGTPVAQGSPEPSDTAIVDEPAFADHEPAAPLGFDQAAEPDPEVTPALSLYVVETDPPETIEQEHAFEFATLDEASPAPEPEPEPAAETSSSSTSDTWLSQSWLDDAVDEVTVPAAMDPDTSRDSDLTAEAQDITEPEDLSEPYDYAAAARDAQHHGGEADDTGESSPGSEAAAGDDDTDHADETPRPAPALRTPGPWSWPLAEPDEEMHSAAAAELAPEPAAIAAQGREDTVGASHLDEEAGFFNRDDPVGSQYVDFDEVRDELVQIGIVWLGETNAVQVTELLSNTRSTIDDFVATIDTIRGLHLDGQDPASIQAMAREMHQQAAERLCGA
jgi:hypothetical protein